MKKVIFFSLMIFLAFAGKAQESEDIIKAGDSMPAFTIVSDNGTKVSSDTFKGKVILVNLFATWCPPCQKELAAFKETLWPKYKDNKNFELLVIGREHSDAELEKYNEKKGFEFPLYPDKKRTIFDLFAKSQIPRTYLINKEGKVVYSGKGYTDAEFEALMNKIEGELKK